MRRTDTLEHEESGRAPVNGDLTSAQAVMRRWALFEASKKPFDTPRLLPGGWAEATVIDTSPSLGGRAGTAASEPGSGLDEDGARTPVTLADKVRDEIIEDRTLRCPAT